MQNDSITIHHRFAGDYRVKLSISHALSQSTKLCVFEERVLEIVQTTRDLPEALATTGADALRARQDGESPTQSACMPEQRVGRLVQARWPSAARRSPS